MLEVNVKKLKKNTAKRNILIGAEFDKFVIEHPEVMQQIPDGAQLISLSEYDPDLCKANLKLTKSAIEKEKPVIYIRLKKLAPQKSRIKHVSFELAKAG